MVANDAKCHFALSFPYINLLRNWSYFKFIGKSGFPSEYFLSVNNNKFRIYQAIATIHIVKSPISELKRKSKQFV